MLYHPIWKIKRVFRLLLVAPLLAGSASAQKPPCTLKLDQLPQSIELRGFRLGMTFEQAKASVPQIQLVRPDEFGVARTSKSLNLPAEWPPAKRDGRQLKCDGFSVLASMIAGSPSVRISDDNAQKTFATRREEAAAAADSVIGDQQTKLYYPSGCSALNKISEANRIKFKDKDEAEKAGFKLASDCQ